LVLKDYAYNAAADQPIMAGVKTGTNNSDQTSNTISANVFSFNKEILIQSDQFAAVSVFDLKSVLVVQTELTGQEIKIDMQLFPSGIYLVKIKNETGSFCKMININ
jgi:hypothetical protein